MKKAENTNIERLMKVIVQLSPISLRLMQNNAEVLLARDRIEQREKEKAVQQ